MTKRYTVAEGIKRDLGLSVEPSAQEASVDLTESYVASPKKFSLVTEFLSSKAKTLHDNLYQEYVKDLNRFSAQLDSVPPDDYKRYYELKRGEVTNLNAVYLHELYFGNISDTHSQINRDTLSYMRLERDFGTFDTWQFDFLACGQGSGNGWAVCGYSTYLRRYMNCYVSGHDANIPIGLYPILAIDMWEHAYVKDYGNDVMSYMTAMMKEIRWEIVEERILRAEKIAEAMR